jgi:hypothetical protein
VNWSRSKIHTCFHKLLPLHDHNTGLIHVILKKCEWNIHASQHFEENLCGVIELRKLHSWIDTYACWIDTYACWIYTPACWIDTHACSKSRVFLNSHSYGPVTCENQTNACENHTHACGNHTNACGIHTRASKNHTHSCGSHTQVCQNHIHACGNHTQACGIFVVFLFLRLSLLICSLKLKFDLIFQN